MDRLDVVTFGETLALLTADDIGPLRSTRSLSLGFGGSESNVAIGLARLGHDVAWMGRVGDDELGRLIVDTLRAEGVDVSAATVDAEAPTALMLKERRTPAHRHVIYYRRDSAGSRLSAEHLDHARIDAARVLHVSAITCAISATAAGAVEAAVESARRAGALVSCDLNYRRGLWPDRDHAAARLRQLTAMADIVFAGLDEAVLALGSDGDAQELAQGLAALGPSEVVVRRGRHGAAALVGGAHYDVPARSIEVVDPVGAGDGFAAGYLSGRLVGLDPDQRLQRATTLGAFAVATSGDWEGLPRRDELGLLDEDDDPVRR